MNANINNLAGLGGGKVISGAATTTPDKPTIAPFFCVQSLSDDFAISAVTSSIDYSSVLPMTVATGQVRYFPFCTSITTTAGKGVAFCN